MIQPLCSHLATAIRCSSLAAVCLTSLSFTARAERSYEAWVQRYDTSSDVLTQAGTATTTDVRGNVIVTGYIGGEAAWYTAKYDGLTGRVVWEDVYDIGGGSDRPNAIVTDSLGNVIVTGSSAGADGDLDFFTVKYNGATGAIIWDERFDGPNDGGDEAVAVDVDNSDNVIIAGRSIGVNTGEDIQLLRYPSAPNANGASNPSNGGFRFSGTGTRVDFPTDLVVDSQNFAVVTGNTTSTNGDADIYLAKVNLTTGLPVWDEIISSAGDEDDEGKGVAIDGDNNVIVTAVLQNTDNTERFFTRKYTSAGALVWTQIPALADVEPDFNGPVDVAVDSQGNAIVTGTATSVEDPNFKTTFFTAKYPAAGGDPLWQVRSAIVGAAPNTFQNDRAVQIVIDSADNAIVTGIRAFEDDETNTGLNDDYYTVKYAADDGRLLWDQRLNGDADEGSDTAAAVAVDEAGGVVVTGMSRRGTGNTFQMLTVKYGRFIAASKDDAPGAGVTGSGVPAGAKIASVFTPAIADDNTVAARVTLAKGKTKLGAILVEGAGGSSLPAVQGGAAPGVTGGKYKSFSDPIIAPNGAIAFSAKLSGVNPKLAGGVWTDAFSPALQNVLQIGTEVEGTDANLQSVAGLSIRDGRLLALVKLTGNKAASNALLVFTGAANSKLLLRTNQPITIGSEPATTIKSFSVLAPPKGSPGHGRWQADGGIVARLTLADKRSAVVFVSNAGAIAQLLFTDQAATAVATGAEWKSFGAPAVGTDVANFAALGTLQQEEGGPTKSNDTALVFSANGMAFDDFAREGAAAPGGGNFAGFLDPIVNEQGNVAFLANLGGTGVNQGNKTGLYSGAPAALTKVARAGELAPNTAGQPGTLKYKGFVSVALPSGTGAGPLFLATLSGQGVSKKNNVALFGRGSAGNQQLLRTGDMLGTQRISKLTLLQPVRGAFGVTRSFNAQGGVVLLVSFTDRTQALMPIAIP